MREAFGVPEFRALWLAYAVSIAGDQLARIALSVLVYNRTSSAAWTALTYALTFLPDLVGGPLLAGLADRYPRRRVMVTTDLARGALVSVMAIPHQPLVTVVMVLVIAQLLASPFTAARGAIMPAVLTGDRLVVGTALMNTTYQLALVAGFGVGAVVVTGLGTTGALMLDAATFVVSAVVLSVAVRPHRPTTMPTSPTAGWWSRWWTTLRTGYRVVVVDKRLRALIVIACVSGAYVVPEGLAVPYAAQIHGGTLAVGLLLAANPAGTVIGLLTLRGMRPNWRQRLLGPLAIAACAVLFPTLWAPGLVVSVLLWFLSGLASAYNSIAGALFVRAAPDAVRGQAVGLAQSSLRVSQGLGVVIAGVCAEVITPATVISVASVVGVVLAAAAARSWHRATVLGTLRPEQ